MKPNEVEGVCTEMLPGIKFLVKLDDGREVICYLAGKMRVYNVKVIVGDRVRVAVDIYGGKCSNRIVRRL